jgi:hypothetical protein
MMAWILIWGFLGIPMFFYETSMAPYYMAMKFGFDPVSVAFAALVLGPFVYYLFK